LAALVARSAACLRSAALVAPSVGHRRKTCQLLTRVAAGEIATGQSASRGSPHRLDGRL
jgi:hypothetical protein